MYTRNWTQEDQDAKNMKREQMKDTSHTITAIICHPTESKKQGNHPSEDIPTIQARIEIVNFDGNIIGSDQEASTIAEAITLEAQSTDDPEETILTTQGRIGGGHGVAISPEIERPAGEHHPVITDHIDPEAHQPDGSIQI